MHIRDIKSRVALGVGEAEDVSFLASLTPSLILYPEQTTLGDRIKELCRDTGTPCRPVTDDDTSIITIFVAFNVPASEFLRLQGIFIKAKLYVVNNTTM